MWVVGPRGNKQLLNRFYGTFKYLAVGLVDADML